MGRDRQRRPKGGAHRPALDTAGYVAAVRVAPAGSRLHRAPQLDGFQVCFEELEDAERRVQLQTTAHGE